MPETPINLRRIRALASLDDIKHLNTTGNLTIPKLLNFLKQEKIKHIPRENSDNHINVFITLQNKFSRKNKKCDSYPELPVKLKNKQPKYDIRHRVLIRDSLNVVKKHRKKFCLHGNLKTLEPINQKYKVETSKFGNLTERYNKKRGSDQSTDIDFNLISEKYPNKLAC